MLMYNDDYNDAANTYDFCRNYSNNASPKYMLAYICVCIKGRKGRIWALTKKVAQAGREVL